MLMVTMLSLVTIAVEGFPHGAQDNTAYDLHPEDQAAVPATQHEQAQPQDDSDLYMEPLESQATSSEEPMEGGQTFYPSFSPFNHPPLGHSRPFLYQQEGAYSHRAAPYQQQVDYDSVSRYSGYNKGDNYARGSESAGLLGSGNFGVIRGGTFYNDNEESSNYDYDPYFRHNGHGRPGFGYGGNPKPRQHQQFENFRDFADINVPSNPAYSQFVIVYANKNKTSDPLPNNKPKNIIEHLQMLDLETTSTTEAAPTKKLSKYKQKLALAKRLEKKILRSYKAKNQKTTTISSSSIDQYEPLLALS